MSFELLPASAQDAADLAMLINSAYRGDSSRQGWTTEADLLGGLRTDDESLADMIDKKGSVMLKYTDETGAIIGCVNLQQHDSKIYLGMLTVSPEIQARGIGKQLLSASAEYAQAQNCPSIYMTVISVRHELITWYERHGYKKTGETKPFPTDVKFGIARQPLEFIVMEKTL